MSDSENSLSATESTEVQLKIVHASVPEWEGAFTLKLKKMLRHLKGRRDVWLACSQDESILLIAKRFHHGDKQGREFNNEVDGLKQLTGRGVLCPKLLFTANDGDGGMWVVTEFVENSTELSDIVLHCSDPVVLKTATQEFANALIKHWQLGVHQTDAHLRNFLWDGQSIYTIDVGSIRFTKGALAVSKKSAILEKMLGGYLESFRRNLIQAFTQSCAQQGEEELLARIESPRFIRRVEQQEVKNLRRIWQKSRRDCSQFMKEQHGNRMLLCQRELDPELIEKLKHAPDDLMEMGQRLKSGNTCTVQQIEWAGVNIVVKRYNPKSILYQMMHFFMHSRAMRSWMNGILLCRIGIPSVMPLAVVEESRFGLLNRAYFLMEYFEGEDLCGYLNAQKHSSEGFDQTLNGLSSLFKRLSRFRIIHGDFKAKNILINESELRLIDVDGLRFFVSSRRFYRLFRSDFKRLLDNWSDQPSLRKTLRNRLFDIFNT